MDIYSVEKNLWSNKDLECSCKLEVKSTTKGKSAYRCGVEVTRQKVRRERRGLYRISSSSITRVVLQRAFQPHGTCVRHEFTSLEEVIYFASYVVIDAGDTNIMHKQLLTEREYRENVQSSELVSTLQWVRKLFQSY